MFLSVSVYTVSPTAANTLLGTCKFLRPRFFRRHIATAHVEDVLKTLQSTNLAPMLQHLKTSCWKLLFLRYVTKCYRQMAGLSRQTNLARPCGKEFRYILVFGRNNIFVFSKKNLLIILLSVVNGFGKKTKIGLLYSCHDSWSLY